MKKIITILWMLILIIMDVQAQFIQSDDFSKNNLSENWIIVNQNPSSKIQVVNGKLKMTASIANGGSDLWSTTNHNAPRILQKINPCANFKVETKLEVNFSASYQGAGIIIVRGEEANSEDEVRINHYLYRGYEFFSFISLAGLDFENPNSPGYNDLIKYDKKEIYFRLELKNKYLYRSYSADNITWKLMDSLYNDAPIHYVGLFSASQKWGNYPAYDLEATFDYWKAEVDITNIQKSQNISICQGKSIKVGNSTYNKTGVYRDTLRTNLGCDSIIVTTLKVNPPSNKTQTLSICQGGSIKVGNSVYTKTGIYTDVLKNGNGCDSVVTTKLTVIQPTTKSNDYNICQEDSVIVNNQIYKRAGIFTDTIRTSSGCDSIFLFINISITPELQLELGNDTTLCSDELLLIGTSTSADSYLWNTGSTESNIDAIAPGIYVLTISNNCFSVTDTLTLDAIDCDCKVFIPNAFSPNGDGKNDLLIIKEENIVESKLIIYNKWGKEVFQSLNNTTKWNGAHKDKQLAPDVYGYHYEGTCVKGNKIEFKGNITIVR